jgi:phage shock protein C
MNKKLYKSNTDKKLDGVCGGIGKYFDIDSSVVRLAWVAFTLLGGSGLLAYIICAIVLPREPGGYVEAD